MRRVLVATIAVLSAAAIAGCAEVGDTATTASGSCGNEASADCTPKVGPRGKVRVDALVYRLLSASKTPVIGDPNLFGERANGVYVVLDVKIASRKNESATLTDSVFKLEVNGNTYDPDNSGTVAAMGNGEKPLFVETIGPDSTLQGKVVFDVPPRVLRRGPLLRIGELGFGDTHGYIKLPRL